MLGRAVCFLVAGLALGAIGVEAQGGTDRIGVLGPPEEPRFSEVRDGLKHGLRDQGYADRAIEVLEARAAREAASKLGLELVEPQARSRADIDRGLEALGEADAFLVIPGGLPTGHYAEIIRAANTKRVPTMFHNRTGSTTAALASYGASDAAIAPQLARHVAKILQGTKAGELPVERPMALELVVNLSIAEQIGVRIPPEVLIRVDRVVQ